MNLLVSIALLVFVIASILFAIAESSFFSLSKWQIRQLAEKYPQQGNLIQQLLADPEELLATISFGNTFSNAMIVSIGIWHFSSIIGFWTTIPVLLFLVLIVGEIIPKTVSIRSPEEWSLRIAKFIKWSFDFTQIIHKLASRVREFLVKIFSSRMALQPQGFTDSEYRELMEIAYQHGVVGASEKEIILQIIALDRRTVREVMMPRSKVICIPDEAPISEMIQIAKKYKHRRFPLYDETPDTIAGILNARQLLLNPDSDLSEAIEMPSFVPMSMNLLKLFRSLQRQKRGMAIVLDEYGGMAGIVTMSDILQEVIGSIAREGEPTGLVCEEIEKGKWRVIASMRVEDFQRQCPDFKELQDVDTMGGVVLAKAEVVPKPGESFYHSGFRLTVLQADERRVLELLVEKVLSSRSVVNVL